MANDHLFQRVLYATDYSETDDDRAEMGSSVPETVTARADSNVLLVPPARVR